MKKIKKMAAYFLIGSIGLSSCIGSFKLTNTLFAWNETIGSKWKNELVFILFIIVPVYEIAIVIDTLILNSMEFWSDEPGLGLKDGESKKVASKDGKSEFLITKANDGFNIRQITGADEAVEINFRYDESEMAWYYISGTQSIKLAQMVTGSNGNFIRVFKPDGTSAMVEASLRDVRTIRKIINQPSLAL